MVDSEALYRQALSKNRTGQFIEAYQDLTSTIEGDPLFSKAYLKRAQLSYKLLKKYEEALSDLNKVVELDPESEPAYLHRGIVKSHLLMFNESLSDFEKAIEMDPTEEKAYLNRGKVKYFLEFDETEVKADLNRAVLLGSVQAADMINLFYGENRESVRASMMQGIKQRAEQLKVKNI